MKKWQILAKKIFKLIADNQFILYLAIFFAAFFVYLWIQSTPSFLDPDSFYHLKMSKLIAGQGPILDFPWLQFTVLKNYYIDQHFLYHVAAIPFIKFLGDLAGFKFFTVILATLFIFFTYYFFKKEKIILAEIFTLILLLAPSFLFRISLAKATAFSLLLLFLGIYLIFKQRYWLLMIISFLYVWSYGGFLLLLVMSVFYALAQAIIQTLSKENLWGKIGIKIIFSQAGKHLMIFIKNLLARENLKLIFATLSGLILGLVLNPYFPKNLFFYWQQLVQIGIINFRGLVNVGGEWFPYKFADLISDSGTVFIFGAISLVFFFITIKRQKSESVFFLMTTLLLFLLTLKSKRYVEYFIPFFVYFSAFSLSAALGNLKLADYLKLIKKESRRLWQLTVLIIIYLAIVCPFIMVKDLIITRQTFSGGIPFTRFSGIAQYLKDNSPAKTIILHSSWDDFPMLFYYNDWDYYIVGLDPTFMYNYKPSLYNLYADITMAKKSDNLSQAIRENFQAGYFIVNTGRPQLEANLQHDGNFVKVYEDGDGKIYKLK